MAIDKDFQTGDSALRRFHYWMKSFYPVSFKYSYDEFIEIIKKLKGGKTLQTGLGLGINSVEMSSSKVDETMQSLARNGGGKIPSSYQDFFDYLLNTSRQIDYVDAAKFVVIESAKDALDGAEEFGGSLITSLKTLNTLLPIVVVGGVLFFVASQLNRSTGGDLFKAVKGLKK